MNTYVNIEIIAAYCAVASFVLELLVLLWNTKLIRKKIKNLLLKQIICLTKIWLSID